MELREVDARRSFKRKETSAASLLIKKMRTQQRPDHFETGAGFVVDGRAVKGIWTRADVLAEKIDQRNWWRLRHKSNSKLLNSEPMLIEFVDGVFAAAAAMPKFIATVMCDTSGISALIYRRSRNYGPVTLLPLRSGRSPKWKAARFVLTLLLISP